MSPNAGAQLEADQGIRAQLEADQGIRAQLEEDQGIRAQLGADTRCARCGGPVVPGSMLCRSCLNDPRPKGVRFRASRRIAASPIVSVEAGRCVEVLELHVAITAWDKAGPYMLATTTNVYEYETDTV